MLNLPKVNPINASLWGAQAQGRKAQFFFNTLMNQTAAYRNTQFLQGAPRKIRPRALEGLRPALNAMLKTNIFIFY